MGNYRMNRGRYDIFPLGSKGVIVIVTADLRATAPQRRLKVKLWQPARNLMGLVYIIVGFVKRGTGVLRIYGDRDQIFTAETAEAPSPVITYIHHTR